MVSTFLRAGGGRGGARGAGAATRSSARRRPTASRSSPSTARSTCFPALLILFGAVWLALYLARRITTPLRLVGEGAERIAAGERGVRVDFPSGSDEFRALIASFNRMSERLARSEEEVEFSRAGLVRKNQELEERRRLTETVLETVGTGVAGRGPGGHGHGGERRRTAAARARAGQPSGCRSTRCCSGPGREEIHALVLRLLSGRVSRQDREVIVPVARARPAPGGHGGQSAGLARRGAGCPRRGRRPHAADARAEGRGLGRGRAQAGPRDQEPADADPALGAARAQGLAQVGPRASRRSSPSARARSSTRSRRSRTWSTSSRSSRGCRPPTCSPPRSTT